MGDDDHDDLAHLRGCAVIFIASIIFWIVVGLTLVYLWPWN